jgi:hypothetical protein
MTSLKSEVPRFFLGNFDFEHRLADPRFEPSTTLKRLNAELATCWLSIAQDGDYVWTPLPIAPEFFREAMSSGLPAVIPVTSFSDVPRGTRCVPWGWSRDVRILAEQFGWETNAPTEQAVLLANSRATSFDWEQDWNVGLPGAKRIETLEQFDTATSQRNPEERWVVKAEFGMSARERILGRGTPKEPDISWVRKRLTSGKVVFFEPWVDRVQEVGLQFDIPLDGSPQLIGIAPMLVDSRGQYVGSYFSTEGSSEFSNTNIWQDAIHVALRAATQLQANGYFGSLGIDAMAYRLADGSCRIRPLQDINARWTMGRLSLGWRRLLKPDECGCWYHGPATSFESVVPFNVTRTINTSPPQVGHEACRHRSRVLIGSVPLSSRHISAP